MCTPSGTNGGYVTLKCYSIINVHTQTTIIIQQLAVVRTLRGGGGAHCLSCLVKVLNGQHAQSTGLHQSLGLLLTVAWQQTDRHISL